MIYLIGLGFMAKQIIIEKGKIGDDPSTYKFTFDEDGIQKSGFVIFFDSAYYVYRNECQHLPVELDWQENEFLDDEKNFIVCATHGAIYEPSTGHCVNGPCQGSFLKKIEFIEDLDKIVITI